MDRALPTGVSLGRNEIAAQTCQRRTDVRPLTDIKPDTPNTPRLRRRDAWLEASASL